MLDIPICVAAHDIVRGTGMVRVETIALHRLVIYGLLMSNILHSQERHDVLAHVSGNLKRLRQAAGLSQVELSSRSGISRRMIVAIETGDANISLSSLDKLAAVLGVDFVDLVRNPARATRSEINEITWRGDGAASNAILLCSAPASREAQMWIWSLSPGETYEAEPDPEGWHEMLYVVEGVLSLTLAANVTDHAAGSYVTYPSSQAYSYANNGEVVLRFVRNVIS
jgi:transcriptional regulator with XRE-family HTH domain